MSNINILPLPQRYESGLLHLNILLAPRNGSPLEPLYPGSPSFATANLQLQARLISGLDDLPLEVGSQEGSILLPSASGAIDQAADLFAALAQQVEIVLEEETEVVLPASRPNHFVRKYLPKSYREAFNFQRPITNDAVIDDSYSCAMKDPREPVEDFPVSPGTVTWGQVFAMCLRQPVLARRLGLIREVSISVPEGIFESGGYVFVEFVPGSPYAELESPDIRKYAARIPALETEVNRVLFAPILFPVLPDAATSAEGFDELFIEADRFNDGYAKIVHTNQPISADQLAEEANENPPTRDMGIRLGWDDEHVLIGLNRLMRENPNDPSVRNFMNGILGYRIDVRMNGELTWTSLCSVRNNQPVAVGNQSLDNLQTELCVEIHPTQINGDRNRPYWLAQYFTVWNGQSLAIPDDSAASLYLNEEDMATGEGLARIYEAVGLEDIQLRYGNNYQFRVRMVDLTGGGPRPGDLDQPVQEGLAPIGDCDFRRFVRPASPIVDQLLEEDGQEFFEGDVLRVFRPPLEVPALLFTGAYSNAIEILQQRIAAARALSEATPEGEVAENGFNLALPDPDVVRVRIDVEVESLLMDTRLSISNKENYIHYYRATREFPIDRDASAEIPLEFFDARVLNFGDPEDLTKDIGGMTLEAISELGPLRLPTSRKIRITIRAIGERDTSYFGTARSHIGAPLQFWIQRAATDESGLFLDTAEADRVRGIFLRPDLPFVVTANSGAPNGGRRRRGRGPLPSAIERLANALGLRNKGLALIAERGQRFQMACSRNIRHLSSPDHSSITFANQNELTGQWIVPIRLELNRDWSWDGLLPDSLIVERTTRFAREPESEAETSIVGEIGITRTAGINDLFNPDRSRTSLLFIDSVDPTPRGGSFPDEILLTYQVRPNFRATEVSSDNPWNVSLRLPITVPPSQVPEILSAGVALSPYRRDSSYSSTEIRSRFLWIELTEPLLDPNDALFGRVLAYGPDPLLAADINPLNEIPQESPLVLDPEFIRIISPNQSDDRSGIDAMTVLTRAGNSNYYLLPIPDGMHEASSELFGFFTYEFRVGHFTTWSTTQGRFGRALRTTGLQHPAPALRCSVARDQFEVTVEAPYAEAAWKGRKVTAQPPRTELWALLYAQVPQADGKDFRNVLLNEKRMTLKEFEVDPDETIRTIDDPGSKPYGLTIWRQREINYLLSQYRLPVDAPLSVLCVEIMPTIHTFVEGTNPTFTVSGSTNIAPDLGATVAAPIRVDTSDPTFPLTRDLGKHRILRTSALTKVEANC